MNLLIRKSTFIVLIFAVFLFTDCDNTSSPESDTVELTSKRGEIIELTKEDFLTKVMNIEKAPNEQVYLGDKPCIVLFYMHAPAYFEHKDKFQSLAWRYSGKVIFYQVSIEKEKELSDVICPGCQLLMICYPVGKDPESVSIGRSIEHLKMDIDKIFGLFQNPI